MPDAKVSYTTDDAGHPSMMRVMCLIAELAAILFGSIVVTSPTPDQTGVWMTTMFLLAAFAPKVFSKVVELKFGGVIDATGKQDVGGAALGGDCGSSGVQPNVGQ